MLLFAFRELVCLPMGFDLVEHSRVILVIRSLHDINLVVQWSIVIVDCFHPRLSRHLIFSKLFVLESRSVQVHDSVRRAHIKLRVGLLLTLLWLGRHQSLIWFSEPSLKLGRLSSVDVVSVSVFGCLLALEEVLISVGRRIARLWVKLACLYLFTVIAQFWEVHDLGTSLFTFRCVSVHLI